MSEDSETKTVADLDGVTAAGEGNQEGEADRPERAKVAARMATLRQRGIEVEEWMAEEFTSIERQLQQLRDAVLKRKQPIVWFTNAKEVIDAFDRGILINKNEARKLLGLKAAAKRKQPAHLAAAQARRRAS